MSPFLPARTPPPACLLTYGAFVCVVYFVCRRGARSALKAEPDGNGDFFWHCAQVWAIPTPASEEDAHPCALHEVSLDIWM